MLPADIGSVANRLIKIRPALYVLSAFMVANAHGLAANPLPLQCPPDVSGRDYGRFTDMMQERLGYSLSPQLYGSQEVMNRLLREFETVDAPASGAGIMALYFTDMKGSRLMGARCAGDCSADDYSALVSRCAMEMGSTCLDFAVIIDGRAQCLTIPKPEN
ncbi:hypothetical protein GAO09_27595 [Rhizobiales bacterium RZME27]|uniref:Uncharacterized protein n=1 Tax=Endobacterium cereale TaxID=2663029 RepID=A0A6A8AKV2_9HYPH|nr:hypothetical protein [Endobacterium cereale]MEB2842948.1 hypothetical protein [Endobacterium cereale]MQY49796.1 hypothetical protein [Endobacterium cereale]